PPEVMAADVAEVRAALATIPDDAPRGMSAPPLPPRPPALSSSTESDLAALHRSGRRAQIAAAFGLFAIGLACAGALVVLPEWMARKDGHEASVANAVSTPAAAQANPPAPPAPIAASVS